MLGLVISACGPAPAAAPPAAATPKAAEPTKAPAAAAPSQKGTIKVVTVSPLSGSQSALGEQIKLGAQLAVEKFKKPIEDLGFTVVFEPQDDQASPDVGVAVAKKLVADADVIFVDGHLNSGVALPSSEAYKDANLAMVSPANTNPKITDRNYGNVSRIVGRDDVQGPAGAQFAINELKAKSVYIIHDKTAYGQGVAEFFRKEAEKLGAKVLGFEGTEEKANFDPIINPIKAANPDVVYFGGIYDQGGVLLKQMRDKQVKSAFIGPDGLDSSEIVKIAGPAVVGAYYTTVAGPSSAYPDAADFAKEFKSKYSKDVESFGMYGYDVMRIGLIAIENAIKANGGNKPSRKQVSDAVRGVKDFKGITGTINFNSKGDPTVAKYFVLKFDKAEYPGTVVKTLDVAAP
ncbi:MAG: branched-chain amino acid ABC transporter substrate-binding protein [Chloroflexi bacterium]|nr:branched-chain amino acid ABC transporter substrate-binding protein [Chloroflexota bacterium]